jgi:osmotically inducible protein OsmC
MIQLENIIYTAKTHTTGGRDQGTSRSSDGRLEVRLSRPGASGGGTNPEQLFAAGWSACFLSAMKIAAGKMKVALPDDLAIDAEVDVGPTPGAYGLAARLNVTLPGIEAKVAQHLLDATDQLCPYSQCHPWEHRRQDQTGLSRTIRTGTVFEAAGRAGNRQDAAAEIAGTLNANRGSNHEH